MTAPTRRLATLAVLAVASATMSGCVAPTATPAPTVTVTVTAAAPTPTPPTPSVTPEPAGASAIVGTATAFYDAGSSADAAQAALSDAGRGDDAALVARIAAQPIATWVGGWTADAPGTVANVTSKAAQSGTIALLVIYNIPGRDCGLFSAGGAEVDGYLSWVDGVAGAIAEDSVTWVIVEPDALAQVGDCEGQGDRPALLAGAAQRLDQAGARVFLDAGHSNWRSVDDTVERIRAVGVEHLTGFSTNTSNYNATDKERAWADQVGAAVGLPYVTDTSRNGNGSTGEWCNPRGRALGEPPALDAAALASGTGMVATVWAKVPGESDGTCNGGPAAGAWWEDVALELARNAS